MKLLVSLAGVPFSICVFTNIAFLTVISGECWLARLKIQGLLKDVYANILK